MTEVAADYAGISEPQADSDNGSLLRSDLLRSKFHMRPSQLARGTNKVIAHGHHQR